MVEATAKTPVTMTDGRTVEFTTKQKLNKTSTIGDDGVVSVQLDFRNGQTRTFTIPSAMVNQFAAHGAEQKLGDAIAGEKDEDDQVIAVDDLIERLNNGQWTAQRASGGFAGASVLIRALVEASGKTQDEIKAWLAPKTQAEKLALRRSDRLAPIVQRLEAEKAKTSKNSVDTDALLGELDGAAAETSSKGRKATAE
jgi:hypothetical protein